jgi:hypothetical protein
MSRSYRHSRHFGTASSHGMKWFRTYLHSKERMKVRERLLRGLDADYKIVPWDEWLSPRDGIHYYADATAKDMRK